MTRAQILADVLTSQRGNLYALVPQGKALDTEFGMAEQYPKASVAYSAAALPADANAAPVIDEMRKIMADYAANGVPAELVEAAKRQVVLQAFEQVNHDHEAAAKILGLHPNYLHKLIRTMKLKPALKKGRK